MSEEPNSAAWHESLTKSVMNAGANYVVTVLAGAAVAILGTIVVPIGNIAFRQYHPLEGFLTAYWEFCAGIIVATFATWYFTLRKSSALALIAHAVLAAGAFVVSGLMRLELGLPNVIWIQFLLYFAGMVLISEMAIVGFAIIVRTLRRASRTR